jgi:solute carrier family 10 (sodium/bile acid cotransporter), member 7
LLTLVVLGAGFAQPADEAAAIFNTAFSNMTGIFLSPALILGYLGVSGDVSIGTTFYQLAVRVLAPLVLGQVLRLTSKDLVSFVAKYKPYVARSQEYALVFIIYTVFCQTFSEKRDSSLVSIIWVILFQFILLSTFMTVAWFMLRGMFPDEPQLRVMGLFGCTQKTIAIGVPLIKSIYDGDSRLGLFTLPLLIWYPMQMVIGSALAPRLRAFVASEKKRLAGAAVVVVAADDDNDGEPISTRDAHQVDEEEVEVSLPVTTLDQAPVEVDEERPVSDNPFFSSSS